MRTQDLRHLNISKNPTGNRNLDLPSCGAVPQPTAPPLVPSKAQDLLQSYEYLVIKEFRFLHNQTQGTVASCVSTP